MRYIIWGAPGLGSGIVEAACAELGVDYEARDLDARNDEQRGETYSLAASRRLTFYSRAGGLTGRDPSPTTDT